MQIYVHTALGVPPGHAPRFNCEPFYARATPSFYGKPWFSEVAFRADTAQQAPRIDQYAQLRLLLSFTVVLRPCKEERQELAFVREYCQAAAPDVVTGFTRLQREQPGTSSTS
jgi:hypothetical protein